MTEHNDNVIQFKANDEKKETQKAYVLERDETLKELGLSVEEFEAQIAEHEEVIESLAQILDVTMIGLYSAADDIDWHEIMEASLKQTVLCGFRAGLSMGELNEYIKSANIQEIDISDA